MGLLFAVCYSLIANGYSSKSPICSLDVPVMYVSSCSGFSRTSTTVSTSVGANGNAPLRINSRGPSRVVDAGPSHRHARSALS